MNSGSENVESPEIEVAHTVNACGSRCPLPLLYAKQALKKCAEGEVIKVQTTDPSAKGDFEAMLNHLPHRLIAYELLEGEAAASQFDAAWPRIEVFYILKSPDGEAMP